MADYPEIEVDLTAKVAPATEHWKEIDALREAHRFFWNTYGSGYWVLTRYDDIKEASHQPDIFSNHSIVATDTEPAYRFLPSFLDPPQQGANVRETSGVRLRLEPLDVRQRADGLVRHRATRGPHGKRQAHGHRERGDIVKEDDGIDAEAARQQRGSGRKLHVFGELIEREVAAKPIELRVPASGLAHRPDRGALDHFAARGPDEKVRRRR